jgi:hypothetical protein
MSPNSHKFHCGRKYKFHKFWCCNNSWIFRPHWIQWKRLYDVPVRIGTLLALS